MRGKETIQIAPYHNNILSFAKCSETNKDYMTQYVYYKFIYSSNPT